MLKMKKYIKADGSATKFLICFGFSSATILASSLIMALIAGASEDPTGKVGIYSLVAMLVSAVLGGIFSSRMRGEGGVLYALLVALAIVLVMLLIAVIVGSGKVSGGAFMNYGCYLGTSTLAAVLGKKRVTHRVHRR